MIKIISIAFTSILMSVLAQFCLKAGMSSVKEKALSCQADFLCQAKLMVFEKYLILGFMLYGLGAIVWLFVLSKWDVTKAYPMVGMGFILTLIVGYWAGETISIMRILGVSMIAIGVFIVSKT